MLRWIEKDSLRKEYYLRAIRAFPLAALLALFILALLPVLRHGLSSRVVNRINPGIVIGTLITAIGYTIKTARPFTLRASLSQVFAASSKPDRSVKCVHTSFL